jgi:hypothetical protein
MNARPANGRFSCISPREETMTRMGKTMLLAGAMV